MKTPKLRWLALALAVVVAPAVWVFASDMYFLGFSEDEKRKDILAREIGWNSLRSEFGGGIWPDFSSKRDYIVPEVVVDIKPSEPSLWDKSFDCGTRIIELELSQTEGLSELSRKLARSVIEQSQRGVRFRQWIHLSHQEQRRGRFRTLS